MHHHRGACKQVSIQLAERSSSRKGSDARGVRACVCVCVGGGGCAFRHQGTRVWCIAALEHRQAGGAKGLGYDFNQPAPAAVCCLMHGRRHQYSAHQQKQEVAGCRPDRTLVGKSENPISVLEVFSSTVTVASGIEIELLAG